MSPGVHSFANSTTLCSNPPRAKDCVVSGSVDEAVGVYRELRTAEYMLEYERAVSKLPLLHSLARHPQSRLAKEKAAKLELRQMYKDRLDQDVERYFQVSGSVDEAVGVYRELRTAEYMLEYERAVSKLPLLHSLARHPQSRLAKEKAAKLELRQMYKDRLDQDVERYFQVSGSVDEAVGVYRELRTAEYMLEYERAVSKLPLLHSLARHPQSRLAKEKAAKLELRQMYKDRLDQDVERYFQVSGSVDEAVGVYRELRTAEYMLEYERAVSKLPLLHSLARHPQSRLAKEKAAKLELRQMYKDRLDQDVERYFQVSGSVDEAVGVYRELRTAEYMLEYERAVSKLPLLHSLARHPQSRLAKEKAAKLELRQMYKDRLDQDVERYFQVSGSVDEAVGVYRELRTAEYMLEYERAVSKLPLLHSLARHPQSRLAKEKAAKLELRQMYKDRLDQDVERYFQVSGSVDEAVGVYRELRTAEYMLEYERAVSKLPLLHSLARHPQSRLAKEKAAKLELRQMYKDRLDQDVERYFQVSGSVDEAVGVYRELRTAEYMLEYERAVSKLPLLHSLARHPQSRLAKEKAAKLELRQMYKDRLDQDVERYFQSLVSKMNVKSECICDRPTNLIICTKCHTIFEGRIAAKCGAHPRQMNLMDFSYCIKRKCQSQALNSYYPAV